MTARDLAAQVLQVGGVTSLGGLLFNSHRIRGGIVRAVNYHGTPESSRDNLRRQIQFFCKHFAVINQEQLSRFIRGDLELGKPGLLLTFDDGLRSHYRVAAEILDDFGVKGVFFPVVKFVELSGGDCKRIREFYSNQICWGNIHLSVDREDFHPMNWDELGDLVKRGHAVGCHSLSHIQLTEDKNESLVRQEVVEAKRIMEDRLGTEILSFCWPGGSSGSYSRVSYDLVCRNYRFGFTSLSSPLHVGGNPYLIDRSNVEAHMGDARVRCAVTGITELFARRRRKKLEQVVLGSADPVAECES
jgi:peptidoglycan/xylan/chitin deacetylase (PgdA/CDA1 family)